MSEEDFDYLTINNNDKKVLTHIAEMGERLKALKKSLEEAESAYETAKKEYEHYANVVIPSEMHACGIDSVSLQTGGRLEIKHNYYCQPNKNVEDRKTIVEWLRSHGGSHIISSEATVSASDITKLKDNDIPFVEDTSVNTMKLKSFIKDGLGVTTGVQQFTIDEVPACVHFQEVLTADIDV